MSWLFQFQEKPIPLSFSDGVSTAVQLGNVHLLDRGEGRMTLRWILQISAVRCRDDELTQVRVQCRAKPLSLLP
jgi:hypothetical protein